MDRREFLRRSAPVTALPFFLGGFSVQAYGRSRLLDALATLSAASDRVLVLVQMNGGNDGLNMVIPLDQYSALSTARANVLINESLVLRMTNETGLHPIMTGLKSLYDGGRLVTVQGVSYPNPNQSHFRATDIWLTGSDSSQVLQTGWLGRFLDREYPNFPVGYPNAEMPDPLAVQIGSVVSPGLQGANLSMGVAVTNPNATYTIPGGSDTPPPGPAGDELTYIRQVAQQTQVYVDAIRAASNRVANLSTLYPAGSLASQLRIVARLIGGGLKTRVYVVNIGGFDTHSSQVVSGQTHLGSHANLLNQLSASITAFQDDIRLLGVSDRVLGMTFSEFGRRIRSNASVGTDHGTGAPLFLFGDGVNPGIVGTNPVIPFNPPENSNIPMQFDFRNIYGTILQNWFGVSTTVLQQIIPAYRQTLPLIAPSAITEVRQEGRVPEGFVLNQNYPNPFNPTTTISFGLPAVSRVRVDVYNALGERMETLIDRELDSGYHQVKWTARVASGMYFYRMEAVAVSNPGQRYVETMKMVLMK